MNLMPVAPSTRAPPALTAWRTPPNTGRRLHLRDSKSAASPDRHRSRQDSHRPPDNPASKSFIFATQYRGNHEIT